MRKIINGKLYDTATAIKVAEWANAGSWGDFSHVEEALYRKKTGEFFLHGEGGPKTQYAKRVEQNSWTVGEQIVPMTLDQAKAWAEEHLDGDEYEAVFGPVPEDESTITAAYRIRKDTQQKLRRAAGENGVTIQQLVQEIFDKALS